MNPVIASAIAQAVSGLIAIWRENANKPPEWTPTDQDWTDMLLMNEKTSEDYKKDAAERLGIPWPPETPPVPG